ncbi:MAG: glycoside hydrolase family 88 protein, partial [Bacteroidota bacterium]
ALILWLVFQNCAATRPAPEEADSQFARTQLDSLTARSVAYLSDLAVDSMAIPRSAHRDKTLHGTGSRDWTSGFYPGMLWQLYGYSKDERLKSAASTWTEFIEKEKNDTHTHDLGFKVYCSFGSGYALTHDPHYREVILATANTLIKRYREKVGAIRSWDWNREVWQFPVIIDNMMNLELLFAATRISGDSTYYRIAYQHAETTLASHIRADHSSYHVIDFDTLTGDIRNRHTHQGAAHESAWARGQGWNLYGFAMAYRETRDARFLDQARGIAQYMYEHPRMPAHMVPYWDFDAPNIPREPLDASAATVAVCGLLMLCELDPARAEQYLTWSDRTLQTLAKADFQSDVAPFLLDHSVGSIPGDFEVDVPIIYADYYYVEALRKRLELAINRKR